MGLLSRLGVDITAPRDPDRSVLAPPQSAELETERLLRYVAALRRLAADSDVDDRAFREYARMLLGKP